MKKYKLVACEVLRDEIEWLLRSAPAGILYSIDWLEIGLHDDPANLRRELERRIRACGADGYAAILLSFGLCGRATEGLSPPSGTILVQPNVHDCRALCLGSDARFREEHEKEPGTLYFNRGFLTGSGERGGFGGLGASGRFVTDENGNRRTPEQIREQFVEEYGEDGAAYLMETLFESWKKNYARAVLLDWPGNPRREADAACVKQYAAGNNWDFVTLAMDFRLLENLLYGRWNEDEFRVVR